MIDTKILRKEDFIIQLTPIVKPNTFEWSGSVVINIATSGKNPLNKKDISDLWHLCRMMCSVIPMMHEDADLMYMLDEYASNNDFSEEKEKDSLTIESKTGNVIKLNFKSKTKGSA